MPIVNVCSMHIPEESPYSEPKHCHGLVCLMSILMYMMSILMYMSIVHVHMYTFI